MPWKLQLLGALRADREERTIARFRTEQTGGLLAYLAYFPTQTFSREALIGLLWPDAAPQSGRQRLSSALSSLRHQFENPGEGSTVFLTDAQTVRLHPHAIRTDVAAFEAAQAAISDSEPPARQIDALEQALSLYRGPLLPDCYEDWVFPERERLADQYLHRIRQIVKLLTADRQYRQALDYTHRAIGAAPYREEFYRDLMVLYVRIGQPSAALQKAAELEAILERPLSARTKTLAAEIGQRLAEMPDSQPERPLDLPSRLPIPANEEKVTPLRKERARIAEATSDETPQEGSAPPTASNLPASLTRFFGRQEDQTSLLKRLRHRKSRLLTLKGPGGIGKTRLALELGYALQADFEGALWFVSLGDLTQAQQIPERIMETLRLVSDHVTSPLGQIVQALRERPALLILDNFEHLVKEGAPTVRALLERLPTLFCLVTSRQRLNLEGEQEWAVHPLPAPGDKAPAALLSEYASVQLFVDRAQLVNPDFEVTERNATTVGRLCDRLDGIPLALELAASRAQMFTPQQMLTKLENRFDFLTQSRDVVARQKTMHAAIAWSYSLLTPELQHFFNRLSLFRGGWTIEAAEAICGAGAQEGIGPGPGLAQDCLAQLLECSLIIAEEQGDEIRFTMLETLREFAAQQLTEADRQRTEAQYVAFYLALAETAETHMRGPEQALWLDRLGAEHDNLQTALQRCTDPEMGLRFAVMLLQYWYVRGYLREGLSHLETALKRGESAAEQSRASVLLGACTFAAMQGQYESAERFGTESLAIHRRIGDPHRIAASLNSLTVLAQRRGDLEKGQDYLEQCLALYRALEKTYQISVILANLGEIANGRGDFAAALQYLDEAHTLAEQTGDKYCLAAILLNLGITHYKLGHMEQAQNLLLGSLGLRTELKDGNQLAHVLIWLAILAQEQGEAERAARLLGIAQSVQENAGAQPAQDMVQQAEAVRTRLCSDLGEAVFEAAYAWGRREGLPQALAVVGANARFEANAETLRAR